MKIPSKIISITLEEEGQEPAKISFEMLRCNEQERLVSALGAAKDAAEADGNGVAITAALVSYRATILSKCVSVENLSWESGEPITVQDVKDKNLPLEVVEKILAGYQAAVAMRGGEVEKKNESLPAEPPPA
jgi:hypothetical protein